MTTEAYHAQVDERANQIIDTVVAREPNGLWDAHALLARDMHLDR